MDGLIKDFAHAVRGLRKSPAFTIVALATLALGIGANTAIFSLADLIIRRPIALPQMGRLAVVEEQSAGSEDAGISPANYLDFREASKSFDQLAAYQYWSASDNDRARPEELHGVKVTPNFFAAVGVAPALGREFPLGHETSQNSDEVIISNALWKQRFGGDTAAIGKNLELNNKPYAVIGIMPSRATFPLGAPEFWIPLEMDSGTRAERYELTLQTVGSLRTGVNVVQARAELASGLQFVAVLMGGFGVVALILAAVGVYGVMSNGVTERWREIAIRIALGAQPGKLLSTVIGQGLLLVAIGTTVGLLSAFALAKVLSSLIYGVTAWDVEVFFFVPTVLVAIALLSCYLPARRVTQMDTMETLRFE
ncbi:MAG TPA: ABC transporter permease [Terriglobales bacterium]|nr:ABC transporter permease [Terriglobales bacterium]